MHHTLQCYVAQQLFAARPSERSNKAPRQQTQAHSQKATYHVESPAMCTVHVHMAAEGSNSILDSI